MGKIILIFKVVKEGRSKEDITYNTILIYICKMRPKVKIVEILPKYLFWDMDYSKLDLENDKAFIIPTALYATTAETFEADIQLLERLYPSSDIIKHLKETKENISNKVCLSVADRYHVRPFRRFVLPI